METESVAARLRQLRGWFLVWFVVESIVGTAAAVGIVDGLRTSGFHGPALRASPAGLVVASSLLAEAAILALALWIFHGLLQWKHWARTVLLVVGWLTALGAVTSLLGASNLVLMRHLLPGVDLDALARVSLVTNSLKLLFWGYAILLLQFDREVRAAFPRVAAEA